MTINQYIKSLEKGLTNRNATPFDLEWLEKNLSSMKDALETLGEKEVKDLCVHVISGKTDRVSIDFFTFCYGFAKDEDRPYKFFDDDRMNAQAIKIYESWKHHA